MDSDDDYQSFSPPKELSPEAHNRRFKRLKKSGSKPSKDPLPESVDDPLLFPEVDFAKLEALENGSKIPDLDDSNSSQELILSPESLSQGADAENATESVDEMDFSFGEEVRKTKRVLEFDADVADGVDANGTSIVDESEGMDLETEKVKIDEEDSFEETKDKKKKKKLKGDNGDESKTKPRASNKRREEKERQAYLKELHAESQRLLRETRDASFKPIPVVQKPISSVLAKIRKRKLEISKKWRYRELILILFGGRNTMAKERSYSYEGSSFSTDRLMNLDYANEEPEEDNVEIVLEKEIVAPSLDGVASPNVDEHYDSDKQTVNENDQNQVSGNEDPTPAFRAPTNDTQDLFDDSEPNVATATQNDDQLNSDSEEDFAPSLPSMNLKFDSALVDDDSSSDEEEDNDKENVNPRPGRITDVNLSPNGDPMKKFIDEEAEEEDDSDNDLSRFQENEETEDIDDFEELNDMIATGYEERPDDKDRRNELHQKWLEQQDAAGTDNLMQRLKRGLGIRESFLPDKEPETDEEDEEFDDEAKEEDSLPQNSGRVNIKKAKQIILQLFSEKEDAYLSDDDDDTLRRHAQRLLIRREEQATIVSPADDENSKEVFGLIKKLNIVSENKRKPKALSFFDSVLKVGNGDTSSKSSFLGRVSNHSIPSSHKQVRSVRSFIFGRDDSNSRSSISISEDSSDTVLRENHPTKNPTTAKYSSSQSKIRSQTRNGASEKISKTSLLEILKRSSSHSQAKSQGNTVDLTKSMFASRAPKKQVKIVGRS
ncbi:hypothetical protein MIMGU_mgv1a001679mg [Erythranthe guttata]|uniref:DNA replication checkpoint mediator MRC1 domain-containing protein n=1 Tax=Erythranthe guttata TaxID=4155 RepID=A0A022RYJ9_ERYGU|nr:hypothetical protein MIMGU_mgv1a001679mg [Erythranthe guttata]